MKRHVFLQKLIQTDTKDASKLNYMDIAMKVVFTQMPAKKGTKKFGERAIAAMIKEYKQLKDGAVPGKPVIAPIDPDTFDTRTEEASSRICKFTEGEANW